MITPIHYTTDSSTDILTVYGTDENGKEIKAYGWVSATTNHFEPTAYDKDGNITETAAPRKMTADEIKAYCQSLLNAQESVVETVHF